MPIVDTEALRRAPGRVRRAVRGPAVLLHPGGDAAGPARRSRPRPLGPMRRLRLRAAGQPGGGVRAAGRPSGRRRAAPRRRHGPRSSGCATGRSGRRSSSTSSGSRSSTPADRPGRRPRPVRRADDDDRHRGRRRRAARLPGPRRGGAARRVGPDPEPGDAGRQRRATRRRPRTRRRRCSSTARRSSRWARAGDGGSRWTTSSSGPASRRSRLASWSTAIELPLPDGPAGPCISRRTRRRGHDLASVTLACSVSRRRRDADRLRQRRAAAGARRGRRAGCSRTRARPTPTRPRCSTQLFADASPSPTSMRASPEYRLAMLRVLGLRGVAAAHRASGGGRVTDRIAIELERQRPSHGRSTSQPHHTLLDVAPRRPRPDRDEGVLPRRRVRRVHGPRRRPERRFVPVLAAEADGARDHDRRGPRGRRRAEPAPAGVPRHRRGAVRVLHPGPARLRAGAARDDAAPDARGGRGGPRRQLCRCAGYEQIIEAVLAAAAGEEHETGRATPSSRRSVRRCRTRTWRRSDASGSPPPASAGRARVTGRAAVRRRHPPRRRAPREARRARRRAGADRPDRHDARRWRVPGVRLVMTAADLPDPMPRFGPQFRDRPVLATGETKYHGEPVAAVAAETLDAAEEAARARVGRVRGAAGASTRSPRRSPRTRRSSRTRRSVPDDPLARRTSSASTATAGATSTRRPPTRTSSSRARTASRWSPSSRSSRTPSWPRRTATGSRSGARSSTRTGCSASSPTSLRPAARRRSAIYRARPGRRVRRQAARQVRAAARVHGAARRAGRCASS